MLEHEMEVAVASCPELFIETGLTLIRRQIVINGRRPDVLFSDALSRHLLVEIQRGRLDEDHLQRHFYYFFDYRAKYPSIHLRLMFIANRLVPQHKDFLDEHGYEYREVPENDFSRRLETCHGRNPIPLDEEIEGVPTPGVLAPSTHEILYRIEREAMTMSYKMLLLMFMSELADADGRVQMLELAEKFQEFFVARALGGKLEENPNRVKSGALTSKTLSSWERTIREMPVSHLSGGFIVDEINAVRWSPEIWKNWNTDLQREIRNACLDRLVRYFERYSGGY